MVVYSSVDDVYARPIAELFGKQSGIKVRLVSDTEETKSTGLLNRLLAEKARPQADIFWSGDPARASVLKRRGLSQPYHSPAAEGLRKEFSDPEGHFTAFSARLRVIIFNRNLVREEERPTSVFDLVDSRFASRACMANPLFGTTSMHAAALFTALGEEKARAFFDSLVQHRVKMLSSNGEVRRRVAAGDFAIGLTDSDDVSVAIRDGQPVGFVLPDQDRLGTLLVPNAVVLLAGCRNPENGKKFIDFLLSPEVESRLAESEAAQIPLRADLPAPSLFGAPLSGIHLMQVDYSELAEKLEVLIRTYLQEWVEKQSS